MHPYHTSPLCVYFIYYKSLLSAEASDQLAAVNSDNQNINSAASLEGPLCQFWQQLCVKKQLSILAASPPVLSLMSKLSWRLRRQVGKSTSIFQQFLVAIYRPRKPPVSETSDKEHIQIFCRVSSLSPTLFFYIWALCTHMYTYKICKATNVA